MGFSPGLVMLVPIKVTHSDKHNYVESLEQNIKFLAGVMRDRDVELAALRAYAKAICIQLDVAQTENTHWINATREASNLVEVTRQQNVDLHNRVVVLEQQLAACANERASKRKPVSKKNASA